jgi:glucosamine--fructose-6-phosphate aminotransferase (isomerizing)
MSLMLDEIRQQPQVLERGLAKPLEALSRLRRRFSEHRPPLIVIVARGTSDNAALFGRYLFEITLEIPTSLAAPSVATLYRRRPIPGDAVVIGISQSGESTDINAFMELAKENDSFTIGITNESASTLANSVDEVLPTRAGEETSVAATKTYTAQLLMLYRLAGALGAAIPESDLKRLPDAVDSQLRHETAVERLADRYRDMSHAVVVGRGLNYANGFEFALKLMETSYVVAAGFSCADFAHGPIAIVEEGFPVFVFTPPGPTFQETEKLLARLERSHVDTICIGAAHEVRGLPCSHWIEIAGSLPRTPLYPRDTLTPIPLIVPAQLFAAHLAESKGLNPDKPRMLSKVTLTL